jgi:lipopolysaccharide cholinephosphotransferase
MCQQIIFSVLESTLRFKYRYQYQKSPRFIGRAYQNGCKILSFIIPKPYLLKSREFIVQKYNKHTTEQIKYWPFKAAKREYFNELTELPFETVLFPVPKMYHEYLTSFYGDYMRIPPENERPKHSPYEPDFGKYAYIKTLDDVLPKKE